MIWCVRVLVGYSCSTVLRGTVWCGAVWRDAVWCDAVTPCDAEVWRGTVAQDTVCFRQLSVLPNERDRAAQPDQYQHHVEHEVIPVGENDDIRAEPDGRRGKGVAQTHKDGIDRRFAFELHLGRRG